MRVVLVFLAVAGISCLSQPPPRPPPCACDAPPPPPEGPAFVGAPNPNTEPVDPDR